ncbi:hypothetical protein BDZ89DRAFT_1031978 [Hymenopellis radicata]|nr:hypothetical protein BDZ89DRAFT_1031978 [Hymenopellis radicata]
MANPGTRPIMIRAGDLVGHLLNPELDLDSPTVGEELHQAYTTKAETMRVWVESRLKEEEEVQFRLKRRRTVKVRQKPGRRRKSEAELSWRPLKVHPQLRRPRDALLPAPAEPQFLPPVPHERSWKRFQMRTMTEDELSK